MSLDWTVIVTLVIAAAAAFYVYTVRAHASTNEYIVKIQALVHELNSKAQNLDKARETAKESSDQVERRNKELQALRDEAKFLKGLVDKLKEQNDSLAKDLTVQVNTAEELRRKLEDAQKSKTKLENDVLAAQGLHWELVSRLHVDDRQRVSALNRLRRPHQYHFPSSNDSPDATEDTSTLPSSETLRAHDAFAPLQVAKSPSESYLLSLQPNLCVSDSDSESESLVFHVDGAGAMDTFPRRSANGSIIGGAKGNGC